MQALCQVQVSEIIRFVLFGSRHACMKGIYKPFLEDAMKKFYVTAKFLGQPTTVDECAPRCSEAEAVALKKWYEENWSTNYTSWDIASINF